MQGPSFKEMPKFKSPEEELSYLRAHVEKREQELRSMGHHYEAAKDTAVRDVIKGYKEVPAEDALHASHRIRDEESEKIVLALKPETHDAVMEELLGIVITKGIKNAIAVVEKMNNPHIDDDFHRILIQYLKTGGV